jgi:hypothetical protein
MGDAIIDLLLDEVRRRDMAARTYADSRGTTWIRMVGRILEAASIDPDASTGIAAAADGAARRHNRDRIAA